MRKMIGYDTKKKKMSMLATVLCGAGAVIPLLLFMEEKYDSIPLLFVFCIVGALAGAYIGEAISKATKSQSTQAGDDDNSEV